MFSQMWWNYQMVKELILCVLCVFLVVLSNCEKEKGSKTKKKGYNITIAKKDQCYLERFLRNPNNHVFLFSQPKVYLFIDPNLLLFMVQPALSL